jgi:hypothetical protein
MYIEQLDISFFLSHCCENHPNGVQYVTLQKYFSHLRLIHLFIFCNPTHKTKTKPLNRWEITNSKLHGPIIMLNK